MLHSLTQSAIKDTHFHIKFTISTKYIIPINVPTSFM